MQKRSRSDHAVLDRHRTARLTQFGKESRPTQPGWRIPRHTHHPGYTLFEPFFKPSASNAPSQDINPEANLSQDDRIYRKLPFVLSQPFDGPGIRVKFGDLA